MNWGWRPPNSLLSRAAVTETEERRRNEHVDNAKDSERRRETLHMNRQLYVKHRFAPAWICRYESSQESPVTVAETDKKGPRSRWIFRLLCAIIANMAGSYSMTAYEGGREKKKVLAAWEQTAAQRAGLKEQLLGRTRLDWFVCTWEILSHMAIKYGWVWKGRPHDPILRSRGGRSVFLWLSSDLFYRLFASFSQLLL